MTDNTVNKDFGIPAATAETPEERQRRLLSAAERLIAAEVDQEEIAALVAQARATRAGANLPTDTEGFRKEYVKVTIFEGNQAFDKPYVELGINGFVIKAPRGPEIVLPKEFVTECLKNAVQEVTVKSQGGLVTRPVHRFPFNVTGPATEDEYRAFQISQKKLAREQTAVVA